MGWGFPGGCGVGTVGGGGLAGGDEGGAGRGTFCRAPACQSSSGSRVEHGSHCLFFFYFYLFNVRFLRPAAPSMKLEEGGPGSGGGEGGWQ